MQSPCLHLYKVANHQLAFHPDLKPRLTPKRFVVKCHSKPHNHQRQNLERAKLRGKKENIWSIDNEQAKNAEKRSLKQRNRKGRRFVKGKRNRQGQIMVSSAMLMELETLLQTQEPVIKPLWNTFASSVSGIWKGVGAVFSPFTAEMEPIEIGTDDQNLYDCYTVSRIEALPSQIQRKINWVTLNPYGEVLQNVDSLPAFESFDFEKSDILEEDVMTNEPGLIFFEDGSYSRGPLDIPVGEIDESKYYLSPTFKFEHCLVKGCHKRLRIVHTIEFSNGGSEIQILRVAVYEEEWVSPANINLPSDLEFNAKPFSQRKRTQPVDLTGPWKVFEMSATPVYGDEVVIEDSNSTPYVYLCTETLKKRSLPDNPVYFGEEEMVDIQDMTVLWLPGGVTGYVDVKKDGILCIGVGWYSDEGINLVMERDYGLDGRLKEVRWKSEVKRRWPDVHPV